jgi:tetratricopeptide (TPR) repeat protein
MPSNSLSYLSFLHSLRHIIAPSRGSRATATSVVSVTLAVILAVTLLGVTARDARAMQLSPPQRTEMKQHYDKATRAYDIQKYMEAVEEYQKAYEIGGDPAMLYNVAQSYRLNDQLPDAIRFYRRYLQRSPNARNRDDVERKIAELEKTVEERRKIAAAVPVAQVPVAPVGVIATPSPVPPPQAEGSSSGRMVAGIIVASIGAAGLITCAITGKLASDKSDEVTEEASKGLMFNPSAESDGKKLEKIQIISGIAGGTALLVGAVLILTALPSSSPDHQASIFTPVLGPGLMGAAATVRF